MNEKLVDVLRLSATLLEDPEVLGPENQYAKVMRGAAKEYETLAKELKESQDEEDAAYKLTQRQSDLLTGVVNALRGPPPEDTWWSHHDAPQLAKKAIESIKELERENVEARRMIALDTEAVNTMAAALRKVVKESPFKATETGIIVELSFATIKQLQEALSR